MKKIIKLTTTLFSVFFISACAATDIGMLKKDIDRYTDLEKELNVRIKSINEEMVASIAKYKNSNDIAEFDKDNKAIEEEMKKLLILAKEAQVYLTTKEVKKYHEYTIQLIEIQAEYVQESIRQFKNLGELDRTNDATLTRIKYGRKIRKVQNKQNKLLKEILNETKTR